MASTTNPPAEPDDASGTGDTSSAPRGNRFFAWMRDTGIRRQPGWVGGVAAGLGLRIGVDPIIVRGVLAVVAVLGGPALLLYAAAWLLLPDTDDRIHAEELGRGRFSAAVAGIGVMVLLSLLPLAQGFWFTGAAFWGELSLGASIGRAIWTGLLLTAVVVVVIIIARRADRSGPTVVPATTDDKPDTVPIPVVTPGAAASAAADDASGADALAATIANPASPNPTAPSPPPAPAADASAEELEAWKAQQALWKEQYSDWKAQRAASDQELRRQRAQEQHEYALAVTAERAERQRLRRLAHPRIPASAAWAAVGLAVVAAAIAAFGATRDPDVADFAVTIALAVGALVLGASIAIAGALRRRSGGLSFMALLALATMLVSTTIPFFGDGYRASYGISLDGDQTVTVLFGSVHLSADTGGTPGLTDVRQRFGNTWLTIDKGESVRLEWVSGSGNVGMVNANGLAEFGLDNEGLRNVGGEWRWTTVIGPDPTPDQTIHITQDQGQLVIRDYNEILAPAAEVPDATLEDLEGAQP